MNSGKYIFSQFVEFLPQKEFYKMVKRYDADKWTKSMSCWNHSLLDKTPIRELFENQEKLDDRYVDDCLQLKLNFEY